MTGNSQDECDDLTSCVNQNLNNDFFPVCDFGEEDGDIPEVLSVDSYPMAWCHHIYNVQ